MNKKKIVVVILTFNSEKIIRKTIKKAKKISNDVVILDSFSKDKTIKIVKKLKCKIINRKFINYSNQRNYIINKFNNKYQWQLHLDADEILSEELIKNINIVLKDNVKNYSYIIKRNVYFLGKILRFGGASNWHLRLFPSKSTNVENKPYDQHYKSKLETKTLNGSIFDMNTSDLYTWTSSHNNWSSLDINTKLKENGKIVKGNFFGNKIERLRFFKNLYIMFPTIIRPFLLFFYKYFILLGFLDGKVGFYYCFLNSLWFRTLIDAKKFEKKIKK